ncbi:hypothetical protein L489_3271 [Bordetella bronchiseptica 00-P-2730]|nr:hypothetical protein L489_3271 [Bordetella bronchiseptica 00-P-2730]
MNVPCIGRMPNAGIHNMGPLCPAPGALMRDGFDDIIQLI